MNTSEHMNRMTRHAGAVLGVTGNASGNGGGGVGGLSGSTASPSELADSSVADFLVLAR